jgi:hypothetical protein
MKAEEINATGNFLIDFAEKIGFQELLVIVILFFTFGLITRILGYYLKRRDLENEIKKREDLMELNRQHIEKTNEYLSLLNEFNLTILKSLEKLQSSVSTDKFNVLSERFLGVNRDFYSSVKSKILGFIENKEQENFYHIKNEIRNLYVDSVLNPTMKFIFSDETFIKRIKDKSLEAINQFLLEVEDIYNNEGGEGVRHYILTKDKLFELISEISQVMFLEYISAIHLEKNVSYIKGD